MTNPGSSIIQFDNQQEAETELQFQDFSHEHTLSDVASLDTPGNFSSFPDSPDLGDDEHDKLLSEEKKAPPSFWEFSYYQSFFDVDTDQVIRRIIWSMVPLPGRATYLDRQIRPTPDLYGPFWITTTLIFSIAISANIADYFTSVGQDNKIWHYDFHKVSMAATAIYSYAFLLPFALWGLMWYRQSSTRYTMLEILCVYGYSLFIYIPISILWVIQVSWLQWMLVLVGAALSGSVLLQTFWPTVRDENRKIATVVLCLILLFHTLLAVGFVAYFFRPTHSSAVTVTTMSTTAVVPVTADKDSSKIKLSQSTTSDRLSKIVSRNTKDSQTENNTNKHSLSSFSVNIEKMSSENKEDKNLNQIHIAPKESKQVSGNLNHLSTVDSNILRSSLNV